MPDVYIALSHRISPSPSLLLTAWVDSCLLNQSRFLNVAQSTILSPHFTGMAVHRLFCWSETRRRVASKYIVWSVCWLRSARKEIFCWVAWQSYTCKPPGHQSRRWSSWTQNKGNRFYLMSCFTFTWRNSPSGPAFEMKYSYNPHFVLCVANTRIYNVVI